MTFRSWMHILTNEFSKVVSLGVYIKLWLVYLNKQLIGIHFITTQLPNDCVSGNRPDMNHMDVVCQPASPKVSFIGFCPVAGKTSESLDNPSSTDHQSGSLRYPRCIQNIIKVGLGPSASCGCGGGESGPHTKSPVVGGGGRGEARQRNS